MLQCPRCRWIACDLQQLQPHIRAVWNQQDCEREQVATNTQLDETSTISDSSVVNETVGRYRRARRRDTSTQRSARIVPGTQSRTSQTPAQQHPSGVERSARSNNEIGSQHCTASAHALVHGDQNGDPAGVQQGRASNTKRCKARATIQ